MVESGLENGVALVTGAGSGIGRGIILSLIRSGCTKLVAADQTASSLAATATLAHDLDPNARLITTVTDVTDAAAVAAMVEAAVREFGRIDFAVHCAGVMNAIGRTDEQELDEYDRVLGVNLRGVFLCSKAVLGQMKGQEPRILGTGIEVRGAVVNIASALGLVGTGGSSPYVMSKHGVVGLTKVDAIDYARDGIRVNVVCPGVVRTNVLPDKMWDEMEPMLQSLPMKRMGLISEIAEAVMFLVGDKAGYITGVALPVDGGYTSQ